MTAAEAPARVRGTDSRWVGPAATGVATALLMAAVWVSQGYSYGRWPQPGFLINVLNLDGGVKTDWFTAQPPVHWAFVHGLALLPWSAVEPTVFVLWLVAIAVLCLSMLDIGRSLGLPLPAAFAAALLLALTNGDALGTSSVVLGYLYPTALSFAIALGGLALLLRDRVIWAGTALGLATLVHPNMGVLMIGAIAPALLVSRPDRWRQLALLAVPCVVLAAPAVIEVAIGQAGGSSLSRSARFDLLALVRAPHHALYSAFPTTEYVTTLSWTALAIICAVALRALRPARILAAVLACTIAICAVGALSSVVEWPLLFVQLLTSRITPLLLVLGILLAARALYALAPAWATAALLAIAALAQLGTIRVVPVAVGNVFGDGALPIFTVLFMEAIGVAVALVLALAIPALQRAVSARTVWALGAAALTLVVACSLYVRSQKSFDESPVFVAFADAARHAGELSQPADVVMAPPDMDGTSLFSKRPAVVSFGTFAFGSKDEEWIQRINALTGDPHLLEGSFGRNAAVRSAALGAAYDQRITTTTAPICRFHPALVITRNERPLPPWLTPEYRNREFTVSRPRVDCQ